MTEPNRNAIERVAAALAAAKSITAFTGAGVSSASGIPTFRGEDGLWKKVRVETLATREAFENDPRLVWEWYEWRRSMIRDAQPNAAHHVLAAWTRTRAATLITQNVDGLHERAGAERLIRLHGSIWHVRCWNRCPAGSTDWLDDRVNCVRAQSAATRTENALRVQSLDDRRRRNATGELAHNTTHPTPPRSVRAVLRAQFLEPEQHPSACLSGPGPSRIGR